MATQTMLTAAQFDQLPMEEGERYELLDGELIEMPSANAVHNAILMRLGHSVLSWMLPLSLGEAIVETEFAVAAERRLKPDLAVLLAEKWAVTPRSKVPLSVVPDIVFEIISPSESAWVLERKVAAYLAAGVTEAVLIYPDGPTAYIHTAAGVRRLTGDDAITSGVLPGWSLPLSELFRGL